MLWLYTTKVGVKNRLSAVIYHPLVRSWPVSHEQADADHHLFALFFFAYSKQDHTHTHTHIHGHSKMDTFNMCTELFFPVFFNWKRLCRVILGESFGKRHLRKLVRSWPFHLHLASFSFFLATELFPRESFQPPHHYLSTQLSHTTCTGGGGLQHMHNRTCVHTPRVRGIPVGLLCSGLGVVGKIRRIIWHLSGQLSQPLQNSCLHCLHSTYTWFLLFDPSYWVDTP